MSLAAVIEQLIDGSQFGPTGFVVAEALRNAAALADGDDATAAGKLRAQQAVIELLDRWSEVATGPELPRLGKLTGRQAHDVAIALGYPPEVVADGLDIPVWDAVEAVALMRLRRRAGLPEQPGLRALLDARRHDGTAARRRLASVGDFDVDDDAEDLGGEEGQI